MNTSAASNEFMTTPILGLEQEIDSFTTEYGLELVNGWGSQSGPDYALVGKEHGATRAAGLKTVGDVIDSITEIVGENPEIAAEKLHAVLKLDTEMRQRRP